MPISNKEKLKSEFLKEMCEQKEDSERFGVYENDGEMVADWWLSKQDELLTALMQKMEEKKEMLPDRLHMTHDYKKSEGFNLGLSTAQSLIKELLK